MPLVSREYLEELSGYVQKKALIKWLRANGFTFVVGADGYPRVDQGHYLARMGGDTSQTLRKSQPNVAALMEAQRNAKAKPVHRN